MVLETFIDALSPLLQQGSLKQGVCGDEGHFDTFSRKQQPNNALTPPPLLEEKNLETDS
jgi:hypothetical protein